ncbi:MAG TPA: PPC domain-containing DNA-binding protein [Bacteroidota bacterium]|nr:PPC domain-containing DNA-binding protein [Bacteroidota bacterium]
MNRYTVKRTLVERLPQGVDLVNELTSIVRREKIRVGRIQGIGATTFATIAYYDQHLKKYLPMEYPGGMEILSLSGNISIRDGEPFVHAHILLGDQDGKVIGGHLLPGTKLFACEVTIDELDGPDLVRSHDEPTGLFLWD